MNVTRDWQFAVDVKPGSNAHMPAESGERVVRNEILSERMLRRIAFRRWGGYKGGGGQRCAPCRHSARAQRTCQPVEGPHVNKFGARRVGKHREVHSAPVGEGQRRLLRRHEGRGAGWAEPGSAERGARRGSHSREKRVSTALGRVLGGGSPGAPRKAKPEGGGGWRSHREAGLRLAQTGSCVDKRADSANCFGGWDQDPCVCAAASPRGRAARRTRPLSRAASLYLRSCCRRIGLA